MTIRCVLTHCLPHTETQIQELQAALHDKQHASAQVSCCGGGLGHPGSASVLHPYVLFFCRSVTARMGPLLTRRTLHTSQLAAESSARLSSLEGELLEARRRERQQPAEVAAFMQQVGRERGVNIIQTRINRETQENQEGNRGTPEKRLWRLQAGMTWGL